jgi:cyclophilin family peptidyl-prolyl cis-trans isomerase
MRVRSGRALGPGGGRRFAWFVCLLALPAAAQEPAAEAARVELVLRASPPPLLDGRIDESEWKDAVPFVLERDTEVLARGRLLRAGRRLYIALETELSPLATGMKFTFLDPGSQRSNQVLLTPLATSRAPLAAFRYPEGRDPERASCAGADARFAFDRPAGFSCEVDLPLDLLDLPATDRACGFAAEMWTLDQERLIAVYPQGGSGIMATVNPAILRPGGTWGDGGEKEPPPNDAIVLLEEMGPAADGSPPPLPVLAGWTDGARKDGPLAALEERAARLIAARPEYVALRALLVQIRVARNDRAGALEALDALGAALPMVAETPQHLFIRMEMLRDLGRYEEALEYLVRHEEQLKDDPRIPREKTALRSLVDSWRIEKEIRRGESERDDLPRVRLKTARGEIVIELFEDDAPNGVANFIALVESGSYDGTRFHWAEGGRHVVGGDPNSRDDDRHNDGFGDPGYLIEPEPGRRLHFPLSVGYADKRRARRAVGSTFAILLSPAPMQDGIGTVLGRVIAGEEAVRRLEHYDAIEKAEVVRRRDHAYAPVKRGP